MKIATDETGRIITDGGAVWHGCDEYNYRLAVNGTVVETGVSFSMKFKFMPGQIVRHKKMNLRGRVIAVKGRYQDREFKNAEQASNHHFVNECLENMLVEIHAGSSRKLITCGSNDKYWDLDDDVVAFYKYLGIVEPMGDKWGSEVYCGRAIQ